MMLEEIANGNPFYTSSHNTQDAILPLHAGIASRIQDWQKTDAPCGSPMQTARGKIISLLKIVDHYIRWTPLMRKPVALKHQNTNLGTPEFFSKAILNASERKNARIFSLARPVAAERSRKGLMHFRAHRHFPILHGLEESIAAIPRAFCS